MTLLRIPSSWVKRRQSISTPFLPNIFKDSYDVWVNSSKQKIAPLRFPGQLQLISNLNSDLPQKDFDFAHIKREQR